VDEGNALMRVLQILHDRDLRRLLDDVLIGLPDELVCPVTRLRGEPDLAPDGLLDLLDAGEDLVPSLVLLGGCPPLRLRGSSWSYSERLSWSTGGSSFLSIADVTRDLISSGVLPSVSISISAARAPQFFVFTSQTFRKASVSNARSRGLTVTFCAG
jgi:hypothetical protein